MFLFFFIFLPDLAECIAESETWLLCTLPCSAGKAVLQRAACLSASCLPRLPLSSGSWMAGQVLPSGNVMRAVLFGAWMETLAAEMICGSLPVPTASLPQFLACWGARFPAMTREKSALLGYLPCPALSLVCLGFCRPSSDACLCVPPAGLVGLLHFYLFSHPFSRAVPHLLGFPGQEQRNNLCCSPCPAKSAGAR